MLGSVGGFIAILGVVVLPITSGDTALRGLRLTIADYLHIDQKSPKNRLLLSGVIFAAVAAILVWAKSSPDGFTILWRYFAWSNQMISLFAFAIIAIYLMGRGYKYIPFMSILPGAWYAFITFSYILSAPIGIGLSMSLSYILGIAFSVAYMVVTYRQGIKFRASKVPIEATAIMPQILIEARE
jgi:carbon starvation protein CstA